MTGPSHQPSRSTEGPAGESHAGRLCVAAMAAAFVLFAGVVGAGFAWDDELLFDSWLQYLDGPGAVLSPPPEIPHFTHQYFRPVVLASYVADEWLAATFFPMEARDQGRRVFFHLSPVLLHVACTGLVFLLGLRLLRRSREHAGGESWIAFGAALLFATHPIHVEPVAWIAGRSDSLCTLFGLGALLAFLDWRDERRRRSLFLTVVLLLLALASKETAAGLVPAGLVLAVSWSGARETYGTRLAEAACLAGGLGTYVLLRAVFGSDGATLSTISGAGASLVGLPGAAGWYLAKLAWPFPQTVFPGEDLGRVLAAAGFAGSVGLAVMFLLWRGEGWKPERTALALVAGGLAVPLAAGATPLATSPVAERYLYLPSVGFCLLVGFLVARLGGRIAGRAGVRPAGAAVPLVLLVCGALALPAGWITSRRLGLWDDPVRFWSSAVETAPRSPVAFINLGQALAEEKRVEEARGAYRRAAELATEPDQAAVARTNLGSLEMSLGRLDAAEREFELALASDPRHATALFNWASVLASKGRSDEAMRRLDTALTLHPRYAKAHLLRGTLLLRNGRPEAARAALETVAGLDPGTPEARRARELLASLQTHAR